MLYSSDDESPRAQKIQTSSVIRDRPYLSAAVIVPSAGLLAYLLGYLICLFQDTGAPGTYVNTIHPNNCPAVTQAAIHTSLVISNAPIRLPGGQILHGLTYNNSYVGPPIVVQLGQEISIDVHNEADTGSTVHWHGMTMRDHAWADGTTALVQRPIKPGHMFRYKFVAEPAGTAYYHSHTGLQFGDGLRGPLIVQDPNDPYASDYDEEIIIMLTDQNYQTGDEMEANLQKNGMQMDVDEDDFLDSNSTDGGGGGGGMGDMGSKSGAVGGSGMGDAFHDDDHPHKAVCKGMVPEDYSDAAFHTILANGKGWAMTTETRQPDGTPAVFRVKQGRRYRFRIIGGVTNWAVKMNISGHKLDIISLDAVNVARTSVDAFIISPGERVDFILQANQPVGNYWINLATLTGLNSPAILSYEGAYDSMFDPTMRNPTLKLGCDWMVQGPETLDPKLGRPGPLPTSLPPPPVANKAFAMYLVDSADESNSQEAILGVNGSILGMSPEVKPVKGCRLPDGSPSKYCWTINWVPFAGSLDGTPLLLPGAVQGPQTYVEEVQLGDIVDVVFINPSGMVHPMHLHGHKFWVLGSGNGWVLHDDGSLNHSLLDFQHSIQKDTHPVPQAVPQQFISTGRRVLTEMNGMSDMGDKDNQLVWGFSVVRFIADNPGIWPFHCHTDLHAGSGMMMAIRVKAVADAVRPGEAWELPRSVETCGLEALPSQSTRSHRSTHMGLPFKLRLV